MNEKDTEIFVRHIFESIEKIKRFTKGLNKRDFMGNDEKQSAIIKQIEIIGEAVKNIPESFRRKYQSIPWSDMAKTRDKFIHQYFGIDLEVVWEIIKEDLPKLEGEIMRILKKEEDGNPERINY